MKKVLKEFKKIKWPSPKVLLETVVQTIIFTAGFALFFYLCQVTVRMMIRVVI